MAEYVVEVQNTEGNSDNISVTGLVNGVQVAAVVNVLQLPGGPKLREKAIDNALIDAYLGLGPKQPSTVGRTYSREG